MKSSKLRIPEVSVIACHHTGDLVHGFTKSVTLSETQSYEVIVVTSDSELATTGIKDCTVIYCEGGPAKKRNVGGRIAKGRFLAFFDDDVEITVDCIEQLKETFTLSDCGMVYGKLYNMEHRTRLDEAGGYMTFTGFIWSRAEQNIVDTGQFEKVEPILAGKSASCMIPTRLFDAIGGFDEDFGILGEETDLSWRVWLTGFKVYFNPKSIAYHAFNTKFKPVKKYYTTTRVQFNGCRNYITMLIKNLEARNLWRILPIHLVVWFTAGLAMVITGKVKQGMKIWEGIWYVLRNLTLIRKKRTTVQEGRKVSDRTIWPHIYRRTSWSYYIQRYLRYIAIGLHG